MKVLSQFWICPVFRYLSLCLFFKQSKSRKFVVQIALCCSPPPHLALASSLSISGTLLLIIQLKFIKAQK